MKRPTRLQEIKLKEGEALEFTCAYLEKRPFDNTDFVRLLEAPKKLKLPKNSTTQSVESLHPV